jgi:hypothetical protein
MPDEGAMTGTCLCGAITVTVDNRPDYIHECNCSLCRKAGAAWGYYTTATASAEGATEVFVRADKEAPMVEIHSCRSCAATTHYLPTPEFRNQADGPGTLGVNMRLFEPDELTGVEVRFPDGRRWSGSGPFGYRRAAMRIGEHGRW